MSKKIWWIIGIVVIVILGVWYLASNIASVDNQTAMVMGPGSPTSQPTIIYGRGHKGDTFGYDKQNYWKNNCPVTSCAEAFERDCPDEADNHYDRCVTDGTLRCEKARQRALTGSSGRNYFVIQTQGRQPATQEQADRIYESCMRGVNLTCEGNRNTDLKNCEKQYKNCVAKGCDNR